MTLLRCPGCGKGLVVLTATGAELKRRCDRGPLVIECAGVVTAVTCPRCGERVKIGDEKQETTDQPAGSPAAQAAPVR